jgi:L-fuconolactonase
MVATHLCAGTTRRRNNPPKVRLRFVTMSAKPRDVSNGATRSAMDRRTFLTVAAGPALFAENAKSPSIPIIDTHIHLFDTTRPKGVPWPGKDDTILYRPALPQRYRKIAQPLGIAGAIVVEASPWLEDNQWVLDVAAKDTMIVGFVGNLDLGKPPFRQQLERFLRNPVFRGIRYGNLWGRSVTEDLVRRDFVSDLKALADSGLGLDTANPNPALIADVLRISDLVPGLRVIIDHLPQLEMPTEAQARRLYQADLRELGRRPRVYVKVSEVARRVNGQVPKDLNFYKPGLDELWDIFGPDRLIYGSDWPNSDHWASYGEVFNLAWQYFTAKGQAVAEKVFWKNSVAAYRWKPRDATQPHLNDQ